MREVNLDECTDNDAPATKTNLLDYYANRDNIQKIHGRPIFNLLDFLTKFYLVKGQLRDRPNQKEVVIITTPQYRYNPNNCENHKKYCYHQLIKYSPWKKEDLEDGIIFWPTLPLKF